MKIANAYFVNEKIGYIDFHLWIMPHLNMTMMKISRGRGVSISMPNKGFDKLLYLF